MVSERVVPTELAPGELDDDRRRLMSAFGIRYDGRHYRYHGYRYDRVADAVAYAKLMQSWQLALAGPYPFTSNNLIVSPSASDRDVMAALAISFKAGAYTYGAFRYDRLADAVNYAKLRRRKDGT